MARHVQRYGCGWMRQNMFVDNFDVNDVNFTLRKHKFYVVADEAYQLLNFEKSDVWTLSSLFAFRHLSTVTVIWFWYIYIIYFDNLISFHLLILLLSRSKLDVTEMLRSSRSSTMTIRRIRPLPRSKMRTANKTTWNTSVVSWIEMDR